jgi:hypothetical protein
MSQNLHACSEAMEMYGDSGMPTKATITFANAIQTLRLHKLVAIVIPQNTSRICVSLLVLSMQTRHDLA